MALDLGSRTKAGSTPVASSISVAENKVDASTKKPQKREHTARVVGETYGD